MLDYVDGSVVQISEPPVRNNRVRYITDSEIKDHISKETAIVNSKFDFIDVSKNQGYLIPKAIRHRHALSVDHFYSNEIASALRILISVRTGMKLSDGLSTGLYVQVKDISSFLKISTNPYVFVAEIVIDSDAGDNFIQEAMKLVKESIHTKNKKIAFTNNRKITILYNSPEEHNRTVELLKLA